MEIRKKSVFALAIAIPIILLFISGSVLASSPPSRVIEPAGPGWHLIAGTPVSPAESRSLLSRRSVPASLPDTRLPASETEASEDIALLASALQNDPGRIFDLVRNRFAYVPTFGSANSATATLYAGCGNDWDQTSLFIALVRVAGYEANYVVGDATYSVERLSNWLGVDDDASAVATALANGGIPVAFVSGNLEITRVWAEVVIEDQTWVFDPAMKEHQVLDGIDIPTTMGYSSETFLGDAGQGATSDPGGGWVKDLNEANVRDDLAGYGMALAKYIDGNMPGADLPEVIGGLRIVPVETAAYAGSLPYALAVSNETTYTSVPASYRHTLRIQHRGIDRTFYTFEIAGARLSITYRDSDGAPELRVDGDLVETGDATPQGSCYEMVVTVDHPYAGGGGAFGDQQGSFWLAGGGTYALVHDLNAASKFQLERRNDILASYLAQGMGTASEAVLAESLWFLGLGYCHQNHLFARLADRANDDISIRHHTVGVIGQESGYFVDIPLSMVSIVPVVAGSDTTPVFRAESMMGSAFEHGILEQLKAATRRRCPLSNCCDWPTRTGKRYFLPTRPIGQKWNLS